MSKRDKTEFKAAQPDRDYPAMDSRADPRSAVAESPEKPESRHFNAWLDRTLPLLQQQLAAVGITSVTAPQDKAKH